MNNALSLSGLQDKKALIIGIGNEKSLAYGCAQVLKNFGCRLGMTYLNEKTLPHILHLKEKLDVDFCEMLDIREPTHMTNLANTIKAKWEKFDFLIHSIAFCRELNQPITELTKEGALEAFHISSYSFIEIIHALKSMLNPYGGVLTMSYIGQRKVIPNYGIMGPLKASLESLVRYLAVEMASSFVRVNALSVGPILTRAASGISRFEELKKTAQENAPLKQELTIIDVGNACSFLLSDMAKAITGVTLHVDNGEHLF